MADVDAWMPLWIGDYLADTGDLTTEEHGAYLLLLMASWRSGGKLPGDPAKLCRTAKVQPKKWPAIWAAIGRFFDISGESVVQGRLVLELEIAQGKKDRARDRGRKGAEARHRASIEQATNKQSLSNQQGPKIGQTPEEQDPQNGQPLRGDGSDSGSGSDPNPPSGPSQPPDLQGDRPPAREPSIWPPHRWLSLFSRAWCAKYGRLAYGNASDAKACGNLADLIERMPEAEILAAQTDAGDMIAAFLASEAQAVTKARHPFGFFVTEFGGLRVPEQPGRPRRNGKTAGNVGVLKDWLSREEAKENGR